MGEQGFRAKQIYEWLWKKSVVDKRTFVIFLLTIVGGVCLNISPAWYVIFAALAGVILKNLEAKKA